MDTRIPIQEIYDKNLNFLIGAGASVDLFPTLDVKIKDNNGKKQTIESLFQADNCMRNKYLFAYYYNTCIKQVITFNTEPKHEDNEVIKNYITFITNIIDVMNCKQHNANKVCNIFTTNYDSCFEYAAEDILKNITNQFIVNDGASGFKNKYFDVNNFYNKSSKIGISENYEVQIPQINLLHLHGNLYWYKEDNRIKVGYSVVNQKQILDNIATNINKIKDLKKFSVLINNENKNNKEIDDFKYTKDCAEINNFYKKYQKLPIVNPTNKKFSDTLINPYYYEMLRFLCFELEKCNTILITFGFSFADEHILQMVKRSLSNRSLQMFICCYDSKELKRLKKIFNSFNNVKFIDCADKLINFTVFNKEIFFFKHTE